MTLRLFELGHRQHTAALLRKASHRPMEELAEEIGQSCHLSFQHGTSLIVMMERMPARRICLSVGEGATLGLADIETDRAVDDSTIYHWASIPKPFTALSILHLRDRGLLTLDDPIVTYVPELRGVHNPFGAMEDITLRHLLSHSAGFRGSTWP